ncbi:MAG: hypothetical protein ACOCWO_01235, partial [Candidatus Muiribacteriaceae bacterium]
MRPLTITAVFLLCISTGIFCAQTLLILDGYPDEFTKPLTLPQYIKKAGIEADIIYLKDMDEEYRDYQNIIWDSGINPTPVGKHGIKILDYCINNGINIFLCGHDLLKQRSKPDIKNWINSTFDASFFERTISSGVTVNKIFPYYYEPALNDLTEINTSHAYSILNTKDTEGRYLPITVRNPEGVSGKNILCMAEDRVDSRMILL